MLLNSSRRYSNRVVNDLIPQQSTVSDFLVNEIADDKGLFDFGNSNSAIDRFNIVLMKRMIKNTVFCNAMFEKKNVLHKGT